MSSAPEEPSIEDQKDDFLEFGLSDGIPDAGKLDEVGRQHKKATRAEIKSLIDVLGGFEYWNDLNEDCRREVVKYLEYAERNRLGICSKRDYETVKATPMDVYRVEIYDNQKRHWSCGPEEFDNVVVQIQLHRRYSHHNRHTRLFELIFSQLGDDTQIRWMHDKLTQLPEKRSIVWESCNYYEEAVKFAEKWMKKCNFELKHIRVEMSHYPFETSSIRSLPKCESFRISTDDVDAFRWWLQKVPDQLKDVQLLTLNTDREVFTLPSEFLNATQIMKTSEFCFGCRADFTDEQFLKLEANRFSFSCVSITDEGVNQFIKRWVNGSGFEFKQAHLWSQKKRNFSKLTSGLEVRAWNANFQIEAWAECCGDFDRICGRGKCVQIPNRVDPYESLTLSVSYNCVSIYASGHKHTRNGITYTYYSVP